MKTNWCHYFIHILLDLYMFRAHRPIFRRVRTAAHTTIGSVSVPLCSRTERHRNWTNGCVNSCTNSPEDGPVGPKHVEIQHYTNKIVTSVGFHCICWKDARYKKLKSETSSLQDSWALPVKSTVQEFFTHRLQSVKLHNSSAPCAHNSSTTVLPQPNTQPTNRSTTN